MGFFSVALLTSSFANALLLRYSLGVPLAWGIPFSVAAAVCGLLYVQRERRKANLPTLW